MSQAIITTLLINTAVFSALFGLMLLVRKLLSQKISAVLQYVLWLAVVIKLIIPFGFESDISPVKWFASTPVQLAAIQPTANPASPLDNTLSTDMNTKTPEVTDNSQMPYATTQPIRPVQQVNQPLQEPLDWIAWAAIAWGTGAMAAGAWLLLGSFQLRRRIRKTLIEVPEHVLQLFHRCKKEAGVRRNVRVKIQGAMDVPAITGIFRPTLILPANSAALDDTRLRHICLHELAHLRNGDLIIITILNILNVLYWFNPLVWLGFTFIRKDMEAVCDQSVIKILGSEGRKSYAGTILQYTSSSQDGSRLQAAMNINDGRWAIERRIRNMYKKNRTGRGMKTAVMIIASIMVAMCIFTACQPAPEKTGPTIKPEGPTNQASQALTLTAKGKALREALGVPAKWTGDSFQYLNEISFKADATIETPDIDKLPLADATPVIFTQEQVDKLAATLLPGCPLYKTQGRPAAKIQEDISETNDRIQMVKEGVTWYDDNLADLQKKMTELQQELNSTSENPPKVPMNTTLGNFERYGQTYYGLNAMADTQAGSMELRVIFEQDSCTVSLARIDENFDGTLYGWMEKPTGVNISREDAQKKALAIAKALDPGLDVASSGVASSTLTSSQDFVWQFIFTRTVNGCPSTYDTQEIGQDFWSNAQATGAPYEQMIICINDKGLAGFKWNTPMKVDKVETGNATLLPFSDVAKAAREALSKNPWLITERGPVAYMDVTIGKMRLGLMRMSTKDKPGTYKIIPVWDLYESGSNFNLITINALDGSVINRDAGY